MLDEHFTIKIFCSYAQADELLSDELEKHLSVLSREGFVTIWNKRRIEAGTDWVKELDHHFNTASILKHTKIIVMLALFSQAHLTKGKALPIVLVKAP